MRNQLQKILPEGSVSKNAHPVVWLAAIVVLGVIVVVLHGIYLRLGVGFAIFLLMMPRKNRPIAAKLFGFLALWGVPSLFGGVTAAKYIILSIVYGVGPVWSGAIQLVGTKQHIRISNGDEFEGAFLVLWHLATFVIIASFAFGWLRLLIWFSQRLCPPLHQFLMQFWNRIRKPDSQDTQS